MESDVSSLSTGELLKKIDETDDGDFRYKATEFLFNKWRRGIDLEYLIGLLRSERSKDRLQGAYYLGELGEDIESLKSPVTDLTNDSLSYCRRAFAGYMATSKFYDERIAKGLAECRLDFDLTVRLAAIDWATRISDERFESFSRLVESGVGFRELKLPNTLINNFWNESSRKRAVRGLDIIRRLRSGEDIEQIRKAVPDEDSVVFDKFLFSRTHRERLAGWRKIKSQH